MKKQSYSCCVLLVSFLLSNVALKADHSAATPYFSIRSQSVNGARKLAGWADKINLYRPDSCENYFVGSALYEYTRSIRSDSLARCLFGDSCLQGCACPTIKISGKDVVGRGERDWLADYFYLPSDFQSLVTLSPRIENHIIDFNLYWGLDEWCNGVYIWVQAPAVHTKWNLNYCEEVIDRGVAEYPPGYFDGSGDGLVGSLERTRLLESFSDYISREGIIKFANPAFDATDLVQFREYITSVEPLKYSKWGDCKTRLNETRLSDVHVTLGWNMWQCDDYHFGLSFKVAVPTGNRPTGEYFFEPVVGNGHHWEVGGGVSFHDVFWRSCDENQYWGFYLEAAITHLFKDKQCRVFDLKNGCNSRYMLAHKLDQPTVDPVNSLVIGPDFASAIAPSAQLKLQYQPVANLTRALVNVSYDVQADIVAMFSYGWCNWTWDIGYNTWIRSCEKFDFDTCTPCIEKPLLNNRLWALKGDSQVAGYDTTAFNAILLSSTQSQATLHTGVNAVEANKVDAPFAPVQNPGVDNALQAFEAGGEPLETNPSGGVIILSSLEPVFLSFDDVDVSSARTKGVSHKVFTNINYNWEMDECCYAPYLGVGAEVEFGRVSKDKDFCRPECGEQTDCKKCALSQWGVWVKGGFSYN